MVLFLDSALKESGWGLRIDRVICSWWHFLRSDVSISQCSKLSPISLVGFILRMHLALKAYQELLATVNEMDMSPDEAVRESSRIIKSRPWLSS